MKTVCENKKLSFQYYVLDTVESGIVLLGSEVKSIRAGKVSLNGAYVSIVGGECFLKGCEISAYDKSMEKIDSMRVRKLLLHKDEILKLERKVKEKGITLIPAKIYFSKERVKCEIALCKGKNLIDKKETIKEREQKIEAERTIKSVNQHR